ncbi:uncharacterized protein METZ01_LOCUS397058, partial [marine metagenome]
MFLIVRTELIRFSASLSAATLVGIECLFDI